MKKVVKVFLFVSLLGASGCSGALRGLADDMDALTSRMNKEFSGQQSEREHPSIPAKDRAVLDRCEEFYRKGGDARTYQYPDCLQRGFIKTITADPAYRRYEREKCPREKGRKLAECRQIVAETVTLRKTNFVISNRKSRR